MSNKNPACEILKDWERVNENKEYLEQELSGVRGEVWEILNKIQKVMTPIITSAIWRVIQKDTKSINFAIHPVNQGWNPELGVPKIENGNVSINFRCFLLNYNKDFEGSDEQSGMTVVWKYQTDHDHGIRSEYTDLTVSMKLEKFNEYFQNTQ